MFTPHRNTYLLCFQCNSFSNDFRQIYCTIKIGQSESEIHLTCSNALHMSVLLDSNVNIFLSPHNEHVFYHTHFPWRTSCHFSTFLDRLSSMHQLYFLLVSSSNVTCTVQHEVDTYQQDTSWETHPITSVSRGHLICAKSAKIDKMKRMPEVQH